jgi:hypothetical protein
MWVAERPRAPERTHQSTEKRYIKMGTLMPVERETMCLYIWGGGLPTNIKIDILAARVFVRIGIVPAGLTPSAGKHTQCPDAVRITSCIGQGFLLEAKRHQTLPVWVTLLHTHAVAAPRERDF